MAHRVTYGYTHRDLPQVAGRCSAHSKGIPHHHKSPQITKGMPHQHRSLPPRGPRADVGLLLTGGGAWTSACPHHLSTGAGQGHAQKKVRSVSASGFSGNQGEVFSRQQTQPGSFNLPRYDISINKNCRRWFHTPSMKTPRWHPTHAILASQHWPEQVRLLGCPPPSAMHTYREKTMGERSCTLRQKDFALCFKNAESFLNTRQHF